MRINLPNQITIARLILAIVFFALLSQYSQKAPNITLLDVCFVLFVVAAITDALDGYLARRQNQVTSLGRILDPFVDKVLICGVFVFFASDGFVDSSGENLTGVRPWMVVVILGRELLVTGLRGFTESQGGDYSAVVSGKIKMILQSITASVILIALAHADLSAHGTVMFYLVHGLVWLTVAVTALSMIQYLARSKHILTHASRS